MSLRCEVLIRIAQTKNRTLKNSKWHYSVVRLMKNVAVLNRGCGICPLLLSFFIRTPGDLTVPESPPPGICHPRQKNANALGSALGGKRGWAQLELTNALSYTARGSWLVARGSWLMYDILIFRFKKSEKFKSHKTEVTKTLFLQL